MKVQLCGLLPMLVFATAFAQGDDPTVPAGLLFDALRSGDSTAVDTLVSSEAMEMVGDNLSALKDQLKEDPEGTLIRLSSAGYTATTEEIMDWSPSDYLNRTVVLPIMMARYAPYSMEITSLEVDRNTAVLQIVFSTQSGINIPSEARLLRERNIWRVSSFMGLSSFP